MKKIRQLALVIAGLASGVALGQGRQITLEDIYGLGTFYTERMQDIQVQHKAPTYTVLEYEGQVPMINLYDFATGKQLKTLFTGILNLSDYQFDAAEEQLLIGANSKAIYRRSAVADYYVLNLQTNKIEKVSNHKISSPLFSPDGKKIAYSYENNLYIYDIAAKTEQQITHDGAKNRIINGTADWVYEEEFGIVRLFEWNADGTALAFVRFDETKVPEFSMDVYGNGLYPQQERFKYPKAGEVNSEVSVWVCSLETDRADKVAVEAYYVPRIAWTHDPKRLAVQTLNRLQNDFKVVVVGLQHDKTQQVIYQEQSKTYVEVPETFTFLKDNSFVISSEKDGYNHLYHYAFNGKLKKQLTVGKWEVTDCYGVDEAKGVVYYQSTENGSINRGVYAVDLRGKHKRALSAEAGTNAATFSGDYSLYVHSFSDAQTPPRYTLNSSRDGKAQRTIINNENLTNRLKDFARPTKEFFEMQLSGNLCDAYLLKPKDFDPKKKYPLLMYQYSGPGSQEVANKWWGSNDYWHAMLTEKGYLVLCVDGRGTGFKGADFKKCTYKQLGKYEVEDQTAAAQQMAKRPYVDSSRIGIWGWSFGGFMSSNCLFQSGKVFKTAIAVAPVTNWRFYDTVYTERFMRTPQENPEGYDSNSPITHAAKLSGSYLLIHGTADDNVHVQNAMVLINSLVGQNKHFDWLIYPDRNHGIYGGATRLQLFGKMTEFILNKL